MSPGKDDLTVLESSHSLVPLAQMEYLIKGADHRNFVTVKAYDEAIHDIFSKYSIVLHIKKCSLFSCLP